MIQPPKFRWTREDVQDLKMKDWIEIETTRSESWGATILGVPFARASISPSGASEFPDAFRRSWELFSTYYIDEMVDVRDFKIGDLGDVKLHATDVAVSHTNIEEAITQVLEQHPGKLYTTIGGDHSITAPIVRAIAKHSEKKIGIVQFDTHLDMRDFSGGRTNGTPIRQLVDEGIVDGENVVNIGLHGFYNAPSLMEAASAHGIQIITLKQLRKKGIEKTIDAAFQALSHVDLIYVTVDMDVLDVAYAPGVPSATPGGMRSDELFECLYEIGKRRIFAIDFVCIDPLRDIVNQTVKATTYASLTFIASTYLHQNK